jgi:transposase
MTTARDNLSKAETVTIAAIEARVPTLVEARVLVESFQAMVRKKLIANLDPWIASASASLIASFASGIIQDKPAVRAALTEPWSNGTHGLRPISLLSELAMEPLRSMRWRASSLPAR